MKWMALLLLPPLLTGNALAHGGEDHADATLAPTVAVEAGPRASAASEEFEFVAVAQGDQLLIHLDRFATNEPVAGARIEIEIGAFKAIAHSVGAGVYSVAGEIFGKPGRHPMVVTIETDASSDLLSATLEVAAPTTTGAVERWPGLAGLGGTPLALLAATAIVLPAAGAIALRRRSRAQGKGRTQ